LEQKQITNFSIIIYDRLLTEVEAQLLSKKWMDFSSILKFPDFVHHGVSNRVSSKLTKFIKLIEKN